LYNEAVRALVICVALAGAGCRSHEIVELSRIEDEVCACKTSECAQAVLDGMPKASDKPSPRAQEHARRILECVSRIRDVEKAAKAAPDDEPVASPPDPSGSAAAAGSGSGSGSAS
jgi:hypothetical protein